MNHKYGVLFVFSLALALAAGHHLSSEQLHDAFWALIAIERCFASSVVHQRQEADSAETGEAEEVDEA